LDSDMMDASNSDATSLSLSDSSADSDGTSPGLSHPRAALAPTQNRRRRGRPRRQQAPVPDAAPAADDDSELPSIDPASLFNINLDVCGLIEPASPTSGDHTPSPPPLRRSIRERIPSRIAQERIDAGHRVLGFTDDAVTARASGTRHATLRPSVHAAMVSDVHRRWLLLAPHLRAQRAADLERCYNVLHARLDDDGADAVSNPVLRFPPSVDPAANAAALLSAIAISADFALDAAERDADDSIDAAVPRWQQHVANDAPYLASAIHNFWLATLTPAERRAFDAVVRANDVDATAADARLAVLRRRRELSKRFSIGTRSPCGHCGALVWHKEGERCCGGGKHILRPEHCPDLPEDPAIAELFTTAAVMKHCRNINSALSMTAVGTLPSRSQNGAGFHTQAYGMCRTRAGFPYAPLCDRHATLFDVLRRAAPARLGDNTAGEDVPRRDPR
jgi:hypothetical protein